MIEKLSNNFILLILTSNSVNCLLTFNNGNSPSSFAVGIAEAYVPYQISMQFKSESGEYKHFCGGSIISSNRILTAAHCCVAVAVEYMTILAGIRQLDDPSGTRSKVESYYAHENYKELQSSDICILNIEPLKLDGVRMDAIKVNDSKWVGGDVPVTLTGWGLRLPFALQSPVNLELINTAIDRLNYPNTLKTITTTTLTNEQCKAKISQVTDTEICARLRLLKGVCFGDSGGPLVMSTEAGLLQIGIVSYGASPCGVFDLPNVYTRVSTFKEWIKEKTEL